MNVLQRIKNYHISEILIALILITLPLGFAVNSISITLFLFIAIYFCVKTGNLKKPNSLFFLFLAIYGCFVLSLIWTTNLTNTKTGLVRFLSYLTIPIAFYLHQNIKINQNKIFNYFSKALVVYAFYALLMAFVSYLKTNDFNDLLYHKLSGNLSNMNAIYLSAFVSIAIAFFINKKEKSKLDFFYVFFLSVFLILLSSKTIITITLIFSVSYFFRNFKLQQVSVKQKIIIVVAFLFFSIASINYLDRIKTEFHKTNLKEVLNTSDFGPNYLWTGSGLRLFQLKAFTEVLSEEKKYLLGEGLNNSQESLIRKYKQYNFYPGFLTYNYHNQYIQIFAELGFVGLLLLMLIFYVLLKKAFFNKDYFFKTFIFLILVLCITESFLWRQRGMVFFITMSLLLYNKKNATIQ